MGIELVGFVVVQQKSEGAELLQNMPQSIIPHIGQQRLYAFKGERGTENGGSAGNALFILIEQVKTFLEYLLRRCLVNQSQPKRGFDIPLPGALNG
ncbi:MAG: hypothetical protein JSW07_10015, partial [bacterium]